MQVYKIKFSAKPYAVVDYLQFLLRRSWAKRELFFWLASSGEIWLEVVA